MITSDGKCMTSLAHGLITSRRDADALCFSYSQFQFQFHSEQTTFRNSAVSSAEVYEAQKQTAGGALKAADLCVNAFPLDLAATTRG